MQPWVGTWRPLEDGQIVDCGYHEFMITPRFAKELLAGGMTVVNGQSVSVWEVDRFPAVNAVLIRWEPDGVREHAQGTYAWQVAA